MTTDQAVAWGGGTKVALARKLGLAQPSVASWGEYPPPLRQMQIERMSKGRLRAEPDVFAGKKRAQPEAA